MFGFLFEGSAGPGLHDGWRLPDDCKAAAASAKLLAQGLTLKPSTLIRLAKKQVIAATALYVVQVLATVVQPVLVLQLLKWCEDNEDNHSPPYGSGLVLVAGLFLTNVGGFMAMQWHTYYAKLAGMKISAATRGALLRKLLQMPVADVHLARGALTNLAAADTESASLLPGAAIATILQPVEIMCLIGVLYILVSWACLGGLAVVLLSLGISRVASSQLEELLEERAVLADARGQLLVGIIHGSHVIDCVGQDENLRAVKTVRLQAWQGQMAQSITDVRVQV